MLSSRCLSHFKYSCIRQVRPFTSFKDIAVEKIDDILIVTINRPYRKNAIDNAAAKELRAAFTEFEHDESLNIAILTGSNKTFCAGFDLKSLSKADIDGMQFNADGPMGPSRMLLSKPVIAAVEGYCVAGIGTTVSYHHRCS
jgi:enoyl-CoA hydratase